MLTHASIDNHHYLLQAAKINRELDECRQGNDVHQPAQSCTRKNTASASCAADFLRCCCVYTRNAMCVQKPPF